MLKTEVCVNSSVHFFLQVNSKENLTLRMRYAHGRNYA